MPGAPMERLSQQPPVFTEDPVSILNDATRIARNAREARHQVVQSASPEAATFSNVLSPLARSENATAAESRVLLFYRFASADPALRKASTKAKNYLDELEVETATDSSLFSLVEAVVEKHEYLDPESLRFLQKTYKLFIRNGMKLLPGSSLDRFKAIQARLSRLTSEFRENLGSTGGVWFTRDELQGVPESVLSRLEAGRGADEGKLLVTFGPADFWPVLTCAETEQTRRRLFIDHKNSCKENIPLFKEVVILRDEAARLLGYPNHASLRVEDKMAKTPEAVDMFLESIRVKLSDAGRQELKRLRELKNRDLGSRGLPFDGRFYYWDNSYYHAMILEKEHLVDHQRISEYFPVETTVSGMFEIVQHLFGLRFLSLDADERHIWHPDVQVFSVWDKEDLGGGFLGYLYLDLFSRDGKAATATTFNIVPGFVKEDGTRQYPATALVCRFPRPAPNRPGLLRHDEVVTLFHELGHCIHDLVSKTAYACFHGVEVVVDFGEAPSQMLEYWCWIPSRLKRLSRHYSTISEEYLQLWRRENTAGETPPPERIPDHLLESLVKAKNVNGATATLLQVSMGMFDMAIHEPKDHSDVENMDMSTTYNKIRAAIWPPDGPEAQGLGHDWGHPQTLFTHLMGEYDAGYYSYLFSKVYAADMFHTVFAKDPMDEKEGMRYRHELLEKGGSQDEIELLTCFLRRRPEIEHFHDELGLTS